jgi:class 3 adenylate cyclase/tetratricopeptide (TPR) repeat protein
VGTTGLVAILFTDIVGSTETVARLGEERAEQLRQTHFALLREGIRAHAGTEVKNLGDGLMVAFGAASDAVACAVAMQQAIGRQNRRAGEPLAMRVGVAVGEATHEDSDYFGTPVIEASRLCARAEGGQVLVTEMARALTGTRGGHDFAPLGPMELKGLPEAVAVHDVRWEALADAAPALPPRLPVDQSLAFIGRTGEREALERAWKSAERAAIQVVFVAGEPGIGKTRLATEIALHAHHQGGLVLLGTCDEDLAVPYQPFVEALRHLVAVCPDDQLGEALAERGGELTRLLPELVSRVPGLAPSQGSDPETERYLLFSAVVGVLAAVSRWRPVLLLLDDLHWVTKPTLLLLKHLIRSGQEMALLIVGTYRDSDIGRGHPLTDLLAELRRENGVERLSLRGLSDGEAVAMMETLAGHDLKGSELALAHAVYAEADGSPFFMRELLRHFFEAGELAQEGERWTFRGQVSGIPDSVREVIGHRLSRLPEPVERLLTLGAVIGREFDVAVLGPLAALDGSTVVEALAVARQAALVREVEGSPGRFAFVHALIRHTLYDELGPARRVELHRRVAETLESLGGGDSYLSDLAHHWVAATAATGVRADDVAKTAHYAEQAGRRAMASLAYEEAAHHFEGALRAARPGGDGAQISELLIVLGDAQRCTGDPVHRETLLEAGRLAHEHGDADRAARAALANQRGVFSRLGAVDGERVAALERALEAVGPAVTPVRAWLLTALATEVHFEGEERRLALARGALGLARQLEDPETLARALAALWFAVWGSTVEGERASIAAELNRVAGQLSDRTLQFDAGVALFLTASGTGDMELADHGLSGCVRIAEELGQPVLLWRAAYLQAHRAMASGRFDDVERWANQALCLGDEAGQPDSRAFHDAHLEVRILQGRFEEAAELTRPLIGQFPGAVAYSAFLAWALAEQGPTEEAQAILDRFQAGAFAGIPPDYLRLVTLVSLSRACARLEDPAGAAALHDLLLPSRTAMSTGQTVWFGPVTHDLGLLTTVLERYDEAEEHFAAAVEVQDRIGARGTVVHTRLEWARMLLRRGRPEDASRASTLLEEAKAGAREVSIPVIEVRIEQLLAQIRAQSRSTTEAAPTS